MEWLATESLVSQPWGKQRKQLSNVMLYKAGLVYLLIMTSVTLSILFLLFTVGLQQPCAQTLQDDLLQSGNTFFYNANTGPSKREHLYQLPLTFTAPAGTIQVAASASSFQFSPSSSGLSFEILGSSGPTSAYAVMALLLGEESSWTSVRVSYLVSARTDFFLGTFSAAVFLLQKYAAGNTVTVVHAIPAWETSSSPRSYTTVAHLSGLRSSVSSYSVNVDVVSFEAGSGQLFVLVRLGSSPVESISISYIIFSTAAPFGYSNFDSMSGSTATYQFVGLNQLSASSSEYHGVGLVSQAAKQGQLSCIGSNCPAKCLTAQSCQSARGQIWGGNCLLCGPSQMMSNGGCQERVTCGPNQFFNGSDCVCIMGYLIVGDTCYRGCGTNAYIFNQQCQCLPGYALSLITYTCVKQSAPACPQNQALVGGVCVCRSGLGMVNGQCVYCPQNSYIAPNGECVCSPGLILNVSALYCVPICYPNASPNSLGQCVCTQGYYNTGSACVEATCKNGQIWTGLRCACPTGMVVDNITAQCSYCNTPDRMLANGTCVCSSTYYPTAIGCSACPKNSLFNASAKNCSCMPNYRLYDDQCVFAVYCPHESVWNPVTQKCDCNSFQNYVINGFCQPCPLYSKWNGSACACNTGFIYTGTLCVCPYGQIWNGATCACPPNKYLLGNLCGFCDKNANYDGFLKKCICKSGWFPVYDKCNQCMTNCAQCTSATTCTTCANGYTYSLAVSGSTVVNSCQAPSKSTSSQLSLKGQVLGNGVVLQGVALSLMPTEIVANGCDICSSLLTVQPSSSFVTITAVTQFVANSQYWFVVKLNLPAVPFIPSFKFTIQINPQYAKYFSSEEMAQQLEGNYDSSPQAVIDNVSTGTKFMAKGPNPQPTIKNNPATTPTASPSTPASSTTGGKTGSTTVPSKTNANSNDLKTLALLFK